MIMHDRDRHLAVVRVDESADQTARLFGSAAAYKVITSASRVTSQHSVRVVGAVRAREPGAHVRGSNTGGGADASRQVTHKLHVVNGVVHTNGNPGSL